MADITPQTKPMTVPPSGIARRRRVEAPSARFILQLLRPGRLSRTGDDAVRTFVSFEVGQQQRKLGRTRSRSGLGRIGHETSVLVYGAAALGDVTPQVAEASLGQALAAGTNHFDTAASYGDAEERMGPTMERVRGQIFLATKSTQRRAEDAWSELNRSLVLLHTDHIDLWQVHAVSTLPSSTRCSYPGARSRPSFAPRARES